MFMFPKHTATLAHIDVSSRDVSVTGMSSTARHFEVYIFVKNQFSRIWMLISFQLSWPS